jgi:hypothetical protein
MAQNVNGAFTEFNRDSVNLDSDETPIARKSRDWLIKQLENLPNKIDDFPKLYDGMHVKFGSFARNTKIRPLDDIDLILTFSAQSSPHTIITYGHNYILNVPEESKSLRKLCNDDNTLNSIKLVNKIVSSLDEIEHYKAADKHRRQEAATLKLNSYDWNFDIVPAFYTTSGYYLIPDGEGGWKATDPRIDQNRTTEVNQKHDGNILQIIRTLKYWNRRAKMPTIPSYLFENLVLNFFDSKTEISKWIDVNLINFWLHLKTEIYNTVSDPKGFQTNLNTLSYDDRVKISNKASDTYTKGYDAYMIETKEKNQEKAINKWSEIFGDKFPTYA